MRVISWFSAGAASAVATKLTPEAIPVRCDTGSEHPDNDRFTKDCERWFGREVEIIKSAEYTDTWDVWEKTRWLSGVNGARCTTELKVVPRLEYQRPDDVHIFGYTSEEVGRFKRLKENFPELSVRAPLIERGLTKSACLAMIINAKIDPPLTYALGFPNANCLPCVKATSPSYWALVRQEYPEVFHRMAKLSRELNVRLCRIKGERKFIDEIPLDHKVTEAIVPSCDFLCSLVEEDL